MLLVTLGRRQDKVLAGSKRPIPLDVVEVPGDTAPERNPEDGPSKLRPNEAHTGEGQH